MKMPKIIEKIIAENRGEFIEKFGSEIVESIISDPKQLKYMCDSTDIEVKFKEVIEESIRCLVIEVI